MAKTQKDISKRYEGNRPYYLISHYLRRWKVWLGLAGLAVGILFVALLFYGHRRTPLVEKFYNVGPISRAHAQIRDCQECHSPVAHPASFLPLVSTDKALEVGCQHCHSGFNFHEAAVTTKTSCTGCHQEHLGAGPMKAVGDTSCLSCHSSASLMAASRDMVLKIPSQFLENPRPANLVYYPEPRLPDGFTQVIHSFATDHPAFRVETDTMSDETAEQMNRFKFNHQIHLTGNIPMVEGHKLDCAYCHKLDASKAYMQPVTYETSCQACHSLQFDVNLPGLQVPHPAANSSIAYNFLLTLPVQVEKYAREQLNITDRNRVKDFVFEKMSALRERTRQGDDLIHDVYFADNQRMSFGIVNGEQHAQAAYPGCAYCHVVQSNGTGEPIIPKPLIPDRWLAHGKFDHSKHSSLSCDSCHGGIATSVKSAEVFIPTKASCVTCHSPKGGVTNTCVTCHNYHHTPPPGLSTASVSPVKEMFLGKD